jgi:release factor glutamine methyltransferase
LKIIELYQQGIQLLQDKSIASPHADAMLLLSFVSGFDRTTIHTYPEKEVSKTLEEDFLNLVYKRCAHIPVQYLIGSQEFMSLAFQVDTNVLIPRQDTEILIEEILARFKSHDSHLSILDIGTGSGCIAISLAKYMDPVKITAIDISASALSLANTNAKLHGVENKIQFLQSDLFEALGNEKFHIIVSNPPYIPTEDIFGLMPEVKNHEPFHALDGGKDGLNFYRSILSQAPKHLYPHGIIGLEIGLNQWEDVKKLMLHSFELIEIIKDLSHLPRVILGKFNGQLHKDHDL